MIAESNSPTGRYLPLKHAALVTVEMVRAARGLDARKVSNAVEDGAFLWVWDIGVREDKHRAKRELRFLADEITDAARSRTKTLPEIIRTVLGERRQAWSMADFCALALCSHQHVYALVNSGALAVASKPGSMMIPRASLESFLNERRIA